MFKYKPYPKYKPSGVEWLGDVPEHWDVSKLKYVLRSIIAGGTPKTDKPNNWCESGDGVPWVSIADMSINHIISKTKKDVTYNGILEKGLKVLPKGTLLYSIFASLGKVAIADTKLTTNQAILGLVPNNNITNEFLYWLLVSLEGYVHFVASSNTQDNLNMEKVANFPIPFSSKNEQTAIANFLDRETTKIDTLIAKQERLIELLREKRQALISHTVTKGLDPNVKMKDSGVAWLGEVPEHWEILPLKFLLKEPLMYGANEPADQKDPNNPRYIRITDIKSDGTLHHNTFRSLPIGIAKHYLLEENSLLFARSGATVGKTFLYDKSWGLACFAGYLIKAAFDRKKAFAKFVKYYTTTSHYWEWLSSSMIQATIENVSAEKYASLFIPLPSINEQQQIADYLDTQTAKIDTLIEKANQAITLLKERREALISAAVTGKIDVREETT